jgi:hypothetical protein
MEITFDVREVDGTGGKPMGRMPLVEKATLIIEVVPLWHQK